MLRMRNFIVDLAVILAVGITLAAIGPFGSFGLGSFAARLAYWLPATLAGYLLVRPTLLLATLIGRKLDIAEPPVVGAGILVASVPITSFILWLNGNPLTYLPSFEAWFQLYVQVVLIGGLVTLLFWAIERRTGASPHLPDVKTLSTQAAATAEPVPFLARLPPRLGTGLIALEMEDHYVRAHTAHGSALILIRMRDAVAELTGIEGMQVHRSWWVARAVVTKVIPNGRSVKLLLDGDIEAPVAGAAYLPSAQPDGSRLTVSSADHLNLRFGSTRTLIAGRPQWVVSCRSC